MSYKSKASEQTPCKAGETSDQGCGAHGCPSDTRRNCTCVTDNQWQCQCNPDTGCKTSGGGGGGTNNPKDIEACYAQNCQNISCSGMSFAEVRKQWRSRSITGACRSCVGTCLQ